MAPLLGAAVFYGLWFSAVGGQLSDFGVGLPLFFGIPLGVGLAAEFLLGLPLLILLTRRRWLSARSFAVGGLGIGLVLVLAFHGGRLPTAMAFLLCVVPATIAAVFFGYVGGWSSNRPLERSGFAGRSTPSR
jgi:hypothetical protein